MGFDPKHLPEDPKTLQQIVLDLMAQLDRESSERTKIKTLLHELLDSKRNRKSEQGNIEHMGEVLCRSYRCHQPFSAVAKTPGLDTGC